MDDIKRYLINGYYPTIGIECHVQLKTRTKLFAPVGNDARDAEPNTLVSHICFGLPGALPVLNEEAVRLAAKAAYALGTKPQKFSKFDRKHYFYPDLPKGYQISQYDQPIILGGNIRVRLDDGTERTIGITRAHIEEDAGKSSHPQNATYSLVDLNRAGTPLLEIVSEPEMHSSVEAKAYAKELWLRMKYADVSDVDLYHGNMRFDVNVSVSKDPAVLGTRTETKNLNSFKSIEKAIDYEIKRQIELLENGDHIVQETRGWLDDEQKTVSQRSKEDAHDYRYFPDPDIPPIELDDEYIAEVESTITRMPHEWRTVLASCGLDVQTIETLLEFQVESSSDFLSLVVENKESSKSYANWIINIEVPFIREHTDIRISQETRRTLYNDVFSLVTEGKLSSNNVKILLESMLASRDISKSAREIATEKDLIQLNDAGALEEIIDEVLKDNPKPVNDIKSGEMKALGFLVGQVMKASQGKANPAEAQRIIRAKLGV